MEDHNATIIQHLHARLLTLKLLPRTGWLQRGVTNVESIAEHTFGVATLALFVGDMILGLDRGRLLSIALLHDMAEALVGDLPFSARRLFGSEAKHQAEQRGMVELLHAMPNAAEYLMLWEEYAEGASREARLIKQLDRVEMLAQALVYEQAGSRAMGEFWEDVDEGWSDEFPLIQALVDCLSIQRSKLNGNACMDLKQGTNDSANGHANGHKAIDFLHTKA